MILHVPPWELMSRPAAWVNWALSANAAMIEAQEIAAQKKAHE